MIYFIDGIRHKYFLGLNQVSYDDIDKSLNEWLFMADSYLVTQDQLTDEFVIDVYKSINLISTYAGDINRLSCASIESLNSIYVDPDSPKFLGWNITKYYYSAFFSAHCILRIFGEGLLRVDQNSINSINFVTKKYGHSPGSCSSGLYCLNTLPNNRFKFFKTAAYNANHEGLWKKFLDFLNDLPVGVYSNLIQSDAQTVIDKIEELKVAICYSSATNGNWLSKIRNSVNYSQSYGIWYPYKGYKNEYKAILTDQFLCKEEPLSIELETYRGRDLIYFVRTCQLINSICFRAIEDMKGRHPQNKSFVINGVYRYHSSHMKKVTGANKILT